jgi:hypothetical protein
MAFLNMQSPPVPCYLVPLKAKYLSQRRILQHPQLMLPLYVTDQVSHPHKIVQNYVYAYFNR